MEAYRPLCWNYRRRGGGLSFGVHPAVRLYYSPEVVEWLCNNREGELPDGAIVIKEMHSIDQELDITLDNQGCLEIQADVMPDSWTIMIKDSSMAYDGWYWGGYSVEDPDPASWQIGNPPVFDASAATNDQFPSSFETPTTLTRSGILRDMYMKVIIRFLTLFTPLVFTAMPV